MPLRWLGKPAGFLVTESLPDGAPLVGCIAWVRPAQTVALKPDYTPIVVGIEPICRAGDESSTIGLCGINEGVAVRLEARPGYALAGVIGRGTDRIDGLRLLFMRLVDGRLDPRHQYESRWVGNRGNSDSEMVLAGDGRAILGLRCSIEKDRLAALALAQFPAQLLSAESNYTLPPTDELARAIRSSGGIVTRDETQPDRPIVGVDRSGWKTQDGDLGQLRGLTTLKKLDLSSSYVNMSPGGAAALGTLTGLEFLDFGGASIRDEPLVNLRNLKHLKSLGLLGTYVSDRGMVHVRGLKSLEFLALRGDLITDATMQHIAGLTNLRTLELSTTLVSDLGFAQAANFKQLRRLVLRTGIVGNDGLAALEHIEDLEEVVLEGRGFTAEALGHLPTAKLHRIAISGEQYDDKVAALAGAFRCSTTCRSWRPP